MGEAGRGGLRVGAVLLTLVKRLVRDSPHPGPPHKGEGVVEPLNAKILTFMRASLPQPFEKGWHMNLIGFVVAG